MQFTSCVPVVDLTQDRLRQIDAIDAPTTLWRYVRRSVVEVFVICLQKPIVDLIEFVIENLLRILITMRIGISPKQNPVLIPVKESSRRARLPSQLANTCGNVHV